MIMCEFSMEDIFNSGSRIISAEDPKIGFNFLVYSFSFPIRLRVVGSGKGKVIF